MRNYVQLPSIILLAGFILLSCGGGNPLEPSNQGQSIAQSPYLFIGSWCLELSGLDRTLQDIESGEGPNVELFRIDFDGSTTPHDPEVVDLEVRTEAFDREAQLLTLEISITNINDDPMYNPIWEPRVYFDFTEATDLLPEDLLNDDFNYDNSKDQWLLFDATAQDDLIATSVNEWVPYIRYRETQLNYNQTIITKAHLQIPTTYNDDTYDDHDDSIARINLSIYGSTTTEYSKGLESVVLLRPFGAYDIVEQSIGVNPENVVRVHQTGVDISCKILTHYVQPVEIPPIGPPIEYYWTYEPPVSCAYTVIADVSDLTDAFPYYEQLDYIDDYPLENSIEFASIIDISENTLPGIYWIPIEVGFDLGIYDETGEMFEGMFIPTVRDVIRVVVEPEGVGGYIPAGYRIFYLKEYTDGNGTTNQLFVSDNHTHVEYQITDPDTFDANTASIRYYDIDETGDNVVVTVVDPSSLDYLDVYWLNLDGWDTVPLDDTDIEQLTYDDHPLEFDARICADGSAAVFTAIYSSANDPHNLSPIDQVVCIIKLQDTLLDAVEVKDLCILRIIGIILTDIPSYPGQAFHLDREPNIPFMA